MTHYKPTIRTCRSVIISMMIAGLLSVPATFQPDFAIAAFPGYNGKIVFQSNRDGNAEIHAMDATGVNQVNLTNNSALDIAPTWSPDGTKIAFHSNRDGNYEIYVMNANGSNLNRLTEILGDDTHPTWSPDGTKIAFTTNRDGNNEIYVMDSDGSNQVNLSNELGVDIVPAWSPDGTKIAFRSGTNDNREIYVMDADGGNRTRLTNNAVADDNPEWSPNGLQILFVNSQGGNDEIFVMDADGTNPINLTNATGSDIDAGFSPDGERIAFRSDRDGNSEIYVMDADGTNQVRLTNDVGDDKHPYWQPILNTLPEVSDDTATVSYNTAKSIDVLGNDDDEETLNAANLTIATQPTHGSASIDEGKVTYTPINGYTGADELTYQICDSFLLDQKCATGVLGITVQAPGTPTVSVTTIGTATFSNGTTSYTSNTSRPTFSGAATPGADIRVEIHSDPIVLTTTANGAGEWSVTPDHDIPDGDHDVMISATKDGVTTTLDTFVLGITAGAPVAEIPNTGAQTTSLRYWGIALLAAGAGIGLRDNRRRSRRTVNYLPPLFPHR